MNKDKYLKEGLSETQVSERVRDGRVNGEQESSTKSIKQIVKDNIFTFFNLLNIALGLLIFLTG